MADVFGISKICLPSSVTIYGAVLESMGVPYASTLLKVFDNAWKGSSSIEGAKKSWSVALSPKELEQKRQEVERFFHCVDECSAQLNSVIDDFYKNPHSPIGQQKLKQLARQYADFLKPSDRPDWQKFQDQKFSHLKDRLLWLSDADRNMFTKETPILALGVDAEKEWMKRVHAQFPNPPRPPTATPSSTNPTTLPTPTESPSNPPSLSPSITPTPTSSATPSNPPSSSPSITSTPTSSAIPSNPSTSSTLSPSPAVVSPPIPSNTLSPSGTQLPSSSMNPTSGPIPTFLSPTTLLTPTSANEPTGDPTLFTTTNIAIGAAVLTVLVIGGIGLLLVLRCKKKGCFAEKPQITLVPKDEAEGKYNSKSGSGSEDSSRFYSNGGPSEVKVDNDLDEAASSPRPINSPSYLTGTEDVSGGKQAQGYFNNQGTLLGVET